MATQPIIREPEFTRPNPPKKRLLREACLNPNRVKAERCRRSLYHFMHEFWDVVCPDEPKWNWHIEYICSQLEKLAQRVALWQPKEHDLIINIPPGTTKSKTVCVMFPDWCWTKWPWMRFIVSSYSSPLALDHANLSRNLIRSDKFNDLFPELSIKEDQDTKSNFQIVETLPDGTEEIGGNRLSTSVGGTVTGFHGHILIVDDPLNPQTAVSELELKTANDYIEQTLSTRKVDKLVTPLILIMQRLHQNDPTGHTLAKKDKKIFHICLPGEIHTYKQYVRPVELILNYKDGLLDPVRLSPPALAEMELDLGQYGYAGQVGQNPTPPTGGMFQVDHFQVIDTMPAEVNLVKTIRYWDKAATKTDVASAARTAGVKMSLLVSGKLLVQDCKKGRWSTDEREDIIRETAEADGPEVEIYHEQEPGSGGKDSALATVKNLLGFSNHPDRPVGDKIYRADPYSVQVNHGNVLLLRGDWNYEFIEEHRNFPLGVKDQVDAASGACAKLAQKKLAGPVLPNKTR